MQEDALLVKQRRNLKRYDFISHASLSDGQVWSMLSNLNVSLSVIHVTFFFVGAWICVILYSIGTDLFKEHFVK